MDILLKIASFLVVLGILVVFHEAGHYVVARLCNVKVLRFSVGFGRILWSKRMTRDKTEFAVSAIPLGGYVKMADEREGDLSPEDAARSFNRASVGKRIAIVAAGPAANLLLAVVLYAATFMAGIPGQKPFLAAPRAATPAAQAGIQAGDEVIRVGGVAVESLQELRWQLLKASGRDDIRLVVRTRDGREVLRPLSLASMSGSDWEGPFMQKLGLTADFGPPLIDDAIKGKPAERAGLRSGDRIVAIDGQPVRSPGDVAAATNAKPGMEVVFRVERDSGSLSVPVVTEVTESGGRRIGIAGLRLKVDPAVADRLSTTVRYGPIRALEEGVRKTWELSVFTVKMLGRILTGEASLKNISGPITLADYAGQSVEAGALVFVSYLALISISLGVLNLLPVPLLDGGQLLYYFAELARGRPLSDRAFELGQRIGMAVLAALMALALFNDFSRLL
ncbi:MAG TPA: RIP metalloprotease RseP [Casimicrobiaceae bacterium]|nr:RIP metalloprotease RseP [Casimicrobiaceae bacterium]